ncbi:MAG: hypothetical protein WCO91_12030 [Gemmataceae bacterium]
MADIEHFDPRTRFIKLSYARNILLLIGSFLVGWNSWVLISLPQMVGREPEKPWFILRGEILKQVGQEKDADPEKSVLALRNKDVKEFANYEAAARATINTERKVLEATLLEKSPPVSWAGITTGVFTLVAAFFLPWMAGALAVVAAFLFLATCGVEIYQFGSSGLLNGIIIKLVCLVLYFYAGRFALEAETGHRVK